MSRIGLIGPSYTSASVNADCQMTMNWIVEKIESEQGKSGYALYRTPGLALKYNLGTAGIRGEITAQGRSFAVAGPQLWELFPPTASPNAINRSPVPMVSDGQPVSMASGLTQLLIASAGKTYVFDLKTNLLTDVSATVGGSVSQVGYSDGFFIALFKNSNKIQTSTALDATSWPGTNFTGVSVFTDNVVGIFIDHRQLWVWGSKAAQVYWNSGNFPFPFDVIDAAFIESGLAAPASPAKADSSLFWLEGDDRGNGIVRRANGFSPARVSTHAQERAFRKYPTIADAVGMSYKEDGHEYYILHFPSAGKTWAYDTATGMWHERGFWNIQNGTFAQHRAQYHTFNFGMHLVGDPTTGSIYQMSSNLLDDFGNNIRRVRRTPHICIENQRMFHHELEIALETGVGPVFQGQATPTKIPMLAATGALRNFGVGENGIIQAPVFAGGDPATATKVYLNDQNNVSTWLITINAQGVIAPVRQTVFVSSYPQAIPFVTFLGDQRYTLQLKTVGAGQAILETIPLGIVGRGPQLMMRYADDGGHTWSDERIADCGQPGQYRMRVRFTRLGSSRDRVYEISVSDPCDWAIIDGYLRATPGYEPQERLVSEMRKRA